MLLAKCLGSSSGAACAASRRLRHTRLLPADECRPHDTGKDTERGPRNVPKRMKELCLNRLLAQSDGARQVNFWVLACAPASVARRVRSSVCAHELIALPACRRSALGGKAPDASG